MLSVFQNYLDSREQNLKYNNICSDSLNVEWGIPQGTVLGPILFNVYINSLLEVEMGGISISYADDTVLFFEHPDWHVVKEKAENGLTTIKHWLDSHKLTLNVDKTKYIAFSTIDKNRPHFNTLCTDSLTIHETKTIKYLGITMDIHLKWTDHVNDLTKKMNIDLYT